MKNSSTKSVLFVTTTDSYFFSHRVSLARAAQDAGYKVHLATQRITNTPLPGITIHPLRYMNRSSKNIIQDIKLVHELYTLYKRLNPTVIQHVAIKPILYGSLAARYRLHTRVVNTFGGMGYIFTDQGWFPRCMRFILTKTFPYILSRTHTVVQNTHDKRFFASILKSPLSLIPGSGVDTKVFTPAISQQISPFTFIYAGRLLHDKGINDLIRAAHILSKEGHTFRLFICGNIDPANPSSLTNKECNDPLITWVPHTHDIRNYLNQSHAAVLASRREGLPKFLLEAASCEVPAIVYDVPGCQDCVVHNVTGLIASTQDDFVAHMRSYLKTPIKARNMGKNARKRAQKLYDIQPINRQFLHLYS